MDNNTALKETWREQPVKMYSDSWHQSYERHAETVENKHGVSRENCSCVRVLSLSYDVFLLLHFKEPRWQLVAFFWLVSISYDRHFLQSWNIQAHLRNSFLKVSCFSVICTFYSMFCFASLFFCKLLSAVVTLWVKMILLF